MTLDQAKRQRDAFMAAHGLRLTRLVNDTLSRSGLRNLIVIVSRDVFEAVEEAFMHWPMRDADGHEFVSSSCVRSTRHPFENLLFKGVTLTYWGAYAL